MTLLRAVQVAALATAGLGCSGGGAGGGDTGITITVDDYGGVVALSAGSSYASLVARFYSDVTITPDPGVLRFGATDKCEIEEGTDPTVTATYFDVGVDIRAVSGSTTLIALNYTSDEQIVYFASSTSGAPVNADYTVSVAGSADVAAGEIGKMFVPNVLSLPSPSVVPGEPLTLEWTAVGADVVYFDFADFAVPLSYLCQVKDDGEFTIPGEVTQAIGADGGIYGQYSQTFDTAQVNSRTVLLTVFGPTDGWW